MPDSFDISENTPEEIIQNIQAPFVKLTAPQLPETFEPFETYETPDTIEALRDSDNFFNRAILDYSTFNVWPSLVQLGNLRKEAIMLGLQRKSKLFLAIKLIYVTLTK